MSDDKKKAALARAMQEINRKHGDGSVMKFADGAIPKVQAVSTGSLALDVALGIGGIPRGRIVEIYGPESSGKTTFCYEVTAQMQKLGGTCAFIDSEHAMDPVYAAGLGVDMGELMVSQPDHGEQALDIAEQLVLSGAVDLIVIDSVAALVPKAELEGEMGDNAVGLQARLMSKACRKLAGPAKQNNTVVIFTNQLREKIGVMFGSPETTPGGRALKFYASVRLDIRRIETLKDGSEAIGNRVRIKVVKNKVAPPFRQAEFPIMFGEGFDNLTTLIEMASDTKGAGLDIVQKAGAFYTFPNGDKAQGMAKAKEYLRSNPEVFAEIDRAVRAHMLGDVELPDDVDDTLDLPEPDFEDQ